MYIHAYLESSECGQICLSLRLYGLKTDVKRKVHYHENMGTDNHMYLQ